MRPIDADALSEAINVSDEELAEFVVSSVKDSKKWDDAFERGKAVRDGMLLDIKDQPTLDCAPVVRCKDCVFYDTVTYANPHCASTAGLPRVIAPDNFCSRGIRRSEGE